MAFAERTDIPFEKSVTQIGAALRGAKASQIFQGEDNDTFAIQFRLGDRMIRFRLLLSDTKSRRSADQVRRQRGRALLLVIKAKLESVESGIETVEQAFLANVVMSDGMTVYERSAEQIAIEYQTGSPSPVAGLLAGPTTS